jgi:hypothetical protein
VIGGDRTLGPQLGKIKNPVTSRFGSFQNNYSRDRPLGAFLSPFAGLPATMIRLH